MFDGHTAVICLSFSVMKKKNKINDKSQKY